MSAMPLVSRTARPSFRGGDPGHAVVPLAMVVGAHIEKIVLLPVVPAHHLSLALDHAAGLAGPLLRRLPLLQRREEPASRQDSVAFQQLRRGRGVHLRRDDALQVLLQGNLIDDRERPVLPGAKEQVSPERSGSRVLSQWNRLPMVTPKSSKAAPGSAFDPEARGRAGDAAGRVGQDDAPAFRPAPKTRPSPDLRPPPRKRRAAGLRCGFAGP